MLPPTAPAEPARCEALARWVALPFWLDYYRADLIDGLDAVYLHVHGRAVLRGPSERLTLTAAAP